MQTETGLNEQKPVDPAAPVVTETPSTETDTGQGGLGILGTPEGDDDARRLNEALALVEQEEQAAINATTKAAADKAAADQAALDAANLPAGALPADKGKAPASAIPLERLNEVNGKRREAEARAIKAEATTDLIKRLARAGQLTPEAVEAIEADNGPAEGAPVITDPVTTKATQTISGLRDSMLKLAQEFDEGNLTMVEFKKKEAEINDAMEIAKNGVSKSRSQDVLQDQVAQARLKIEEDFAPVLSIITPKQLQDMVPFGRAEAEAMLAKQHPGVKFRPDVNPQHLSLLHWNVCNVADRMYAGGLGPISRQNLQKTIPPQPGAQPPVNPKVNPAARPTPEDKAKLAASMPPNLNGIHGGVVENNVLSDDRIMSMSTEDLAKLPEATLKALVGIT